MDELRRTILVSNCCSANSMAVSFINDYPFTFGLHLVLLTMVIESNFFLTNEFEILERFCLSCWWILPHGCQQQYREPSCVASTWFLSHRLVMDCVVLRSTPYPNWIPLGWCRYLYRSHIWYRFIHYSWEWIIREWGLRQWMGLLLGQYFVAILYVRLGLDVSLPKLVINNQTNLRKFNLNNLKIANAFVSYLSL